ncbi:hypothetical protein C0J52_12187 [Blattella germanica]|nr:hypothetical protein C0J52_12187 [Blattella germanica]
MEPNSKLHIVRIESNSPFNPVGTLQSQKQLIISGLRNLTKGLTSNFSCLGVSPYWFESKIELNQLVSKFKLLIKNDI